jgi:hypothetical protein
MDAKRKALEAIVKKPERVPQKPEPATEEKPTVVAAERFQ